VITISSSTARRKYRERSSLISASATALGWRPFFVEPSLRFVLVDDRKDLDLRFSNVIKHPDICNPEPVLRLREPTQSLDPAFADLRVRVGDEPR